jgi:hypothetical protein
MRSIPLNKGLSALVSDEDYEVVSQFKWYADIRSGAVAYAARARTLDEIIRDKNRGRMLLHRFLMQPATDETVDHRNGNGLDCRRENLRLVSRSVNICNQKARAGSGFKGVYKVGDHRWQVHFMRGGTMNYIGSFSDPAAGARAYDKAIRTLGLDLPVNFPSVGELPARTND